MIRKRQTSTRPHTLTTDELSSVSGGAKTKTPTPGPTDGCTKTCVNFFSGRA